MKVPELYNRQTKKIELENTYKVNGLAFLYKNTLGRALTKSLLNKAWYRKPMRALREVAKKLRADSKIYRPLSNQYRGGEGAYPFL